MKKQNWFQRLANRIGVNDARGQSKHVRGKRRPHGWRRSLRNARKRQRQARRMHR